MMDIPESSIGVFVRFAGFGNSREFHLEVI